jgi:hypothetical protein
MTVAAVETVRLHSTVLLEGTRRRWLDNVELAAGSSLDTYASAVSSPAERIRAHPYRMGRSVPVLWQYDEGR